MIQCDGHVGAADAFCRAFDGIYFPEQFQAKENVTLISLCQAVTFFPKIIFKLTNTISVINGSIQAGSKYNLSFT